MGFNSWGYFMGLVYHYGYHVFSQTSHRASHGDSYMVIVMAGRLSCEKTMTMTILGPFGALNFAWITLNNPGKYR